MSLTRSQESRGKTAETLAKMALSRTAGGPAGSRLNSVTSLNLAPIAPAVSIQFDAPSYTPLTTGQARIDVTANVNAHDPTNLALIQATVGDVRVGLPTQAKASGGNAAAGSSYAFVPILAGVALTPGCFVGSSNGALNVSADAADTIAVTITELQTH